MTIEERAKEYAEQEISGFPDGSIWAKGDVMIEMQMSYEDGATEQHQIDIEKACEWFSQYLFEIGYPDDWCRDSKVMRPNGEQRFRKAMEGISGNDKEIPSNSCNSNKNLQELTWGDIQCSLDITEGVKEDISQGNLMDMDPVDYCVEILKRFKENK